MTSIFNYFWKRKFPKRTLSDVKQIARVLIIDDRKPQLIEDLKNEGWHVRYLSDLDSYNNIELLDSHIICLDIVGVGEKLRCDDGMGLVEGIKEKYPSKRVLLYSSVRKHDIFDQAIDQVDKRVFKDGQPYQFIRSVEQLALQAFDWENCVEEAYNRFKPLFGNEMSLAEFEAMLRKNVKPNGEIDIKKLAKTAIIGLDVSSKLAQFIAFAVR